MTSKNQENDTYSIAMFQESEISEDKSQKHENNRQLLREKITNLINYLCEKFPEKENDPKKMSQYTEEEFVQMIITRIIP